MHVPIEIYTWEAKWKELQADPVAYAQLRELIPNLPKECPDYTCHLWAGAHDLRNLVEAGIEFGIDKATLRSSNGSMIVRLQDKLMAQIGVEKAAANGNAAQIAIPDLGLLFIEEVTYLEDAYTETLQEHLGDGWRILVVCPPDGQSRPNYVLGRKKS